MGVKENGIMAFLFSSCTTVENPQYIRVARSGKGAKKQTIIKPSAFAAP